MAAKALLFSALLVQCIYGLFAAPFLPLAAEYPYPASFGCGYGSFGYGNGPFGYNGIAYEAPFAGPLALSTPLAYESFAAPYNFGYNAPFGFGYNGPFGNFRYGAAIL